MQPVDGIHYSTYSATASIGLVKISTRIGHLLKITPVPFSRFDKVKVPNYEIDNREAQRYNNTNENPSARTVIRLSRPSYPDIQGSPNKVTTDGGHLNNPSPALLIPGGGGKGCFLTWKKPLQFSKNLICVNFTIPEP